MNYEITHSWNNDHLLMAANAHNDNMVSCNWTILCEQLLRQWTQLTPVELEKTGHDRHNIANLIHVKYGVPPEMAENYLSNFERTLPTLGIQTPKSLNFQD